MLFQKTRVTCFYCKAAAVYDIMRCILTHVMHIVKFAIATTLAINVFYCYVTCLHHVWSLNEYLFMLFSVCICVCVCVCLYVCVCVCVV